MSRSPADPAKTRALLIGIESYAAGSDWDLDGPARDVIGMYSWLRERGVPADHIRVLVSPLMKNAKAFHKSLTDAGIKDGPLATSDAISQALQDLHQEEGDLFLLFWAGHAAIQQAGGNVVQEQKHRLFTTDATTDVKTNFEWDGLQGALASDYYNGFRRQILIVDACADRRKDFKYTTKGVPVTFGNTADCQQFVMFAASPGETAKNLDDEQRGLFSRELLLALQEDARAEPTRWSPDLEAVARRVLDAFRVLRETGKATQTPSIATNWEGVWRSPDPLAASPSEPSTRFALVIGVSRYKHGKPPKEILGDEDFTNLEAAARDAKDLYDFLSTQPGYVVGRPLLDADATLAGILQEIDALRVRCEKSGQKDPVVEIFFSGHGARDDAGRSYLVPHDARRNQLFATALWDQTFDTALKQVPTKRMLLYLDACHSGDFAAPHVKDAPAPLDPTRMAGVAGDSGRFVVASCRGGQRSYEVRTDAGQPSRGLFASHLLQFLSGDATDPHVRAAVDEFEDERIELLRLFETLRSSVQKAAREWFTEPQEPFANFQKPTGIFIPNKRLERRRQTFLDAVIAVMPSIDSKAPTWLIRAKLREFLERGNAAADLEPFFKCFEEGVRRADSPDDFADYAKLLLNLFQDARKARTSGGGLRSQTFMNTPPSGRAGGANDAPPRPIADAKPDASPMPSPRHADAASVVNPTVHGGARAPGLVAAVPILGSVAGAPAIGSGQADAGPDRRRFTGAAAKYILESLLTLDDTLPLQLSDTSVSIDAIYQRLKSALVGATGVTEREFSKLLNTIGKQPPPDWDRVEADIQERFDERWPKADPLNSLNSIGIRGFGGREPR